jgi:ABC-type amino acid transport substrate-binding protein
VQRQQVVDFTFPYIWEELVPVVPKGSPIKSIRQFKPPAKIGAARGTSAIDTILAVYPDAIIRQYPDIAATAVALSQGLVDVVTCNRASARLLASRIPDLEIGEAFVQDAWGIVLRQNDSRWRGWLEFTMQRMWLEGLYQKIYKKWYLVEPDFTLWSGGPARLQPGIETWDGKV